ncbi:MAG: methyltransferase [Planctomycetota bacterium]|jgi:SAM-dependent methyltransferase
MNVEGVEQRMEFITRAAGLFKEAAVLMAGNELGVFEALADKPLTASETAAKLKSPPRGVRILLDALTAMDLLHKENDTYRNGPEASEFLLPDKPFYFGDMLRHNAALYESFGKLSEAVRSGEPVRKKGGKRSPRAQRDFILAMANIGALSARKLLPILEFRGDEKVLDLGGGPGTYLDVFCEAHENLTGTLFDLPETTAIASEYLAGRPTRGRIEIRDGDFHGDELGEDFDAVLVSNIIHSLDPDAISMIFEKCARALAPGGRIIVKDFFLETDRTSPRYGAVFAVNMFLGTRGGNCYSFDEVEAWLTNAGFVIPDRIPLTPQTSLIIAAKPAAK